MAGKNRLETRTPEIGAANGSKSHRTIRTTIVLPEPLDQNLELYALKSGIPKGEVIKRVLSQHLIQQGLQPDRTPRTIEVAY